jgi:hypothetical protein
MRVTQARNLIQLVSSCQDGIFLLFTKLQEAKAIEYSNSWRSDIILRWCERNRPGEKECACWDGHAVVNVNGRGSVSLLLATSNSKLAIKA